MTRRLLLSLASAALICAGLAAPAQADEVVTPGNFTGYGFDQCLAPTQAAMDAWWLTSPYAAVGIYISGNSRACRNQPNLTPDWVSRQSSAGWRLLPITLGPQASCSSRYPRYGSKTDPTINPSSSNNYAAARTQGAAEADKAVEAANALGIGQRSTLWYDLEGFPTSGTACRESAKWFLSAWTERLHALGYVSGVYSSASSGMKVLDDARVLTPGKFTLPDYLWIADWNGRADVYSSYLRTDGWMPHRRMHQYRGGHDETYGGVTINIDTNWVDVGKGSYVRSEPKHCGGAVSYNLNRWLTLRPGSRARQNISSLQCMLRGQRLYAGPITGRYDAATSRAAQDFQRKAGRPVSSKWSRGDWMTLLTWGGQPVLKFGSASPSVRKVQRSLTAAGFGVPVTGIVDADTVAAVKDYQRSQQMTKYGVVTPSTWKALAAGRY